MEADNHDSGQHRHCHGQGGLLITITAANWTHYWSGLGPIRVESTKPFGRFLFSTVLTVYSCPVPPHISARPQTTVSLHVSQEAEEASPEDDGDGGPDLPAGAILLHNHGAGRHVVGQEVVQPAQCLLLIGPNKAISHLIGPFSASALCRTGF